MDLSPQDAMSIVTEMKRTIGRDVNIIENTGVILASTNKTRIGTVHEGARQLIENGLDSFTVWADDPSRGVQHGINLPVVLDGRIECVIGVTGDPAEVSVFGAVIRRLMEIMLESLRQRRRLAQMDSARDAFLEALFFENSLSPAELAERGQLLGFAPESACAAVLLRPVAETGAEALAGLSGQTLLANIRRTDLPGKGSHCAILRGELAALLCGVGRREAGTFVQRLCAEAESLCGAAMAAGICSGFIVAILQTRMGVNSLLAGIIVNTALYSINIAVMGGSSLLNLNKTDTVFSLLKSALSGTPFAGGYKLIVSGAAVLLALVFITLFLRTRLGLAIRATGNNPDMVRSSSANPAFTTTVGLCAANALTGLSGCLMAQSQKAVDINLGTGMVTIALASLLIGGTVMGRGGVFRRAVGVVLGSVIFRLVYTVALRLNMPAFMLKLVSSVIVILAISVPYLKTRLPMLRRRMAHAKGKGGEGAC